MNNLQIIDESGDRKYFTLIPNYILNHSSHWDREVYIQMKRIAGENGTVWTSQTTLAKQCGFSVNRLKQSLKYLLEHKWIEKIGTKKTQSSGGKQEVNEYKIIDLWNLNNQFYQEKFNKGVSPADIPLPQGVSRNEQRGITDEAKGVSPESYKEEPVKQEPLKKIVNFSNNPLFNQTWENYKEMRNKIRKPMTKAAENLALAKLGKEKVETAIAILEQSIFNSWQGLFPLKEPLGKKELTPQQQLERHARMLLEACGGDHDLAIARFTTGKYTEGVKYEPNDLMKVLHIIHF